MSLVRCLNCLWLEQKVEDHFTKALVCCLYKKGAHDNPENYRPIYFLNSCYKIFTSVIQVRLSTVLESYLGTRSMVLGLNAPLPNRYFVYEDSRSLPSRARTLSILYSWTGRKPSTKLTMKKCFKPFGVFAFLRPFLKYQKFICKFVVSGHPM